MRYHDIVRILECRSATTGRPAPRAAFLLGGRMDHEYTVLPDGSIFWLNRPSDYEEARMIAHDELGDLTQSAQRGSEDTER